jgi:hypothetical protein
MIGMKDGMIRMIRRLERKQGKRSSKLKGRPAAVGG